MKVICIKCGHTKESKFRFEICPVCSGTMTASFWHHTRKSISLLQAISNKDKKLESQIMRDAKAGKIVRII